MNIKAIETVYKGYRFRSRLEARWAVFFDALGIEWEYEKEGFDLGDGDKYLPDFWLPQRKCWVEIKGPNPGDKDIRKCEKFAEMQAELGVDFRLLIGNIPEKTTSIKGVGVKGIMSYKRIPNYSKPIPKEIFFWGQWPDTTEPSRFMKMLWVCADNNEMNIALRKGRQARFEHGEMP